MLATARADPGWGDFLARANTPRIASLCAQHVRSSLCARMRLNDRARMERLVALAPEAEQMAGYEGPRNFREMSDWRRRSELLDVAVRRVAYLVALENPTLLPFLFPDGARWPDDETPMSADRARWGVNGEPRQEREEADPRAQPQAHPSRGRSRTEGRAGEDSECLCVPRVRWLGER